MPPTHGFICFLYDEIKIVTRQLASDKIVIETLALPD